MRHTVVRGSAPNHPYRKRPNIATPPVHADAPVAPEPVAAVVTGEDVAPVIAPEPEFDSALAPTPEQHTGPAMEDWLVDEPVAEPEPVVPATKSTAKAKAPAKAKGTKKK